MKLDEIKKDLYKIDEKTYLKKSKKGDYRLIYPIKDSKGNFIWKNFLIGGKVSNLFLILFILSLVLYLSWGYRADINAYQEYIEKNCNIIRVSYEEPNFSSFLVDVDEHDLFIPSTNNDEILQ